MNKSTIKSNLPTKICVHCQRPFARRKKRERCREQVKYCSEQCKKESQILGKYGSGSSLKI